MKKDFVVDNEFVYEEEKILTVLKTSLFFANDGFTVYDCNGEVVFRVDSYGPGTREVGELVLMDAQGRCLLTVRKKRPSLHQRWEGYLGEGLTQGKAIFSVRRSSIIGRCGVTVETYNNNTGDEYQIEGCFAKRCCTIFDVTTKQAMAEIKRKVDASTNVVLGKEVFSLLIKPGFDGAFAMGIVLVLDQINGGDEYDGGQINGDYNGGVLVGVDQVYPTDD